MRSGLLPLLQTVLSQLDGTAWTTLRGEIDTGGLASVTYVIDDDDAGSAGLTRGQNDIAIPRHYATSVADTIRGHAPEKEVRSCCADIRVEELGNGRASGVGGGENLPG